MGKKNIWIRRAVQAVFLLLWVFLFWTTAHQTIGSPLPPDLFLSTDPLVAIIAMVTARVWVAAMIGGLALIALTIVFGRFFCGWVCPLGTVLDIFGRLWVGRKEKELSNDKAWRRVKYYLLVVFAVSAVMGGQLLLLDPLVLSFRAVALGMAPSRPGEASLLPLLILIAIIALSGITHRFWCRYLCPLGAFYGAVSRFSIFRRKHMGCDRCKGHEARQCQLACAMHCSVMKQGAPEECVRCMACEAVCPKESLSFPPAAPLPTRREELVTLDRRTFLVTAGVGTAAGLATVHSRAGSGDDTRIVRPPRISNETTFLALCVRCGQCIRSCPTGTLQPLFLEAGFAGLWSPAITPRVGGCEEGCNACSVACPTGAIPAFGPSRAEKWTHKMGSVQFERHRCISYADDAVKPCLKCVEACPNRAIVVDRDAVPVRPLKVIYDQCVGCGRCETACRPMVVGSPAMILNSNGAGSPALLVADPTPLTVEIASNSEKTR